MALLFCESFDHLAAGDLNRKYDTVGGSNTISTGRFGSALHTTNQGDTLRWQISTVGDFFIIGCAWYQSDAVATNTPGIWALLDGTTIQVDLRVNALKQLVITRNGTTLQTGTTIMSSATWYYIQAKILIANSGTWEVLLNGATELSGSGDTQQSANAQATVFGLGGIFSGSSNFGQTMRIDDVYLCDDLGGVNDDYLGDVRVEAIFPNGNGNSSQFDGSDGNQVDNYLLVDENDPGPDDDTTYVQSADVGDKDTYAFGNLASSTGTVYGVQILPYARKTDAGSRSICTVARLSGTETDGPNQALSTTANYLFDMRETKPGGGSWTISDVNSAEFGQKVTV